jgi:hypothetical protein
MPPRHSIAGLALALVVGLRACIACPVALAAQTSVTPCTEHNPMSESFLGCIRSLIDGTQKANPTGDSFLAEPVRGLLEKLAKAEGYQGTATDLDELKRWSLDLKRDPMSNRNAIAVLDNAIASHSSEIRVAVSTRTTAKNVDPGTNVHPEFVRQKLAFLTSEKAKFYDRGPFEVVRRSLLATAFEEAYFLEWRDGKSDNVNLRNAIQVVDELLARYNSREYDYLRIRQQTLHINSHLFWRVSLLFAMGEKSEAVEILRDLALNNRQFGLETTNPGHVYVYRVFSRPYEIKVLLGADSDGGRKVEINDPWLLKRFYNPAQLAVVACTRIESAGGTRGVEEFSRTVSDLVFSDYYVVAASADDPTKLQRLDSAIRRIVDSKGLQEEYTRLLKDVISQGGEIPNMMKLGARLCGVEDTVLQQIYSPFQFRSEIKHIKNTDFLVFGGRLNATQARTISDFLNLSVFPKLQEKLEAAYIARMRIDQ